MRLKKYYYKKINSDYYVNLGNSIYLIDDNLVSRSWYFKDLIVQMNNRVDDINKLSSEIKNVQFYLYYIERDIDIDFETNKKAMIYEYLKDQLNLEIKTSKLEINNIEEYKEYFYKTDHHWNYKGSYKGYLDIIKLLELNDKKYNNKEVCLKSKMAGSRSNSIGGQQYFIEDFCAYKFDLPKHDIYINNKLVSSYGDYDELMKTQPSRVSYGSYYGGDYGLIEFDYNKQHQDNLLIIGESYDNAINELVSSYFNKTYNVDLRHYENHMGEKFNIVKFIKENNIDKVLFVGNGSFYVSSDFDLEVIK